MDGWWGWPPIIDQGEVLGYTISKDGGCATAEVPGKLLSYSRREERRCSTAAGGRVAGRVTGLSNNRCAIWDIWQARVRVFIDPSCISTDSITIM